MARHHRQRNRRVRRAQAARRRRVVGLGTTAGAFIAAAMALPTAHADILDVVIDPIIAPVQHALTGVTDVVSSIDPTTGMDALSGLDPAGLLAGIDPSSVGAPGADATSAAAVSDALSAAASQSDPLTTAASSTDLPANPRRLRIRGQRHLFFMVSGLTTTCICRCTLTWRTGLTASSVRG